MISSHLAEPCDLDTHNGILCSPNEDLGGCWPLTWRGCTSGRILVMNVWLVLYTWLQHTHPDVPHYGSDDFTFLKGALSTIDRPYPYWIDQPHHHIGTTHVLHHLNFSVPHYRAEEYTKAIKQVLGPSYRYDRTPVYKGPVHDGQTMRLRPVHSWNAIFINHSSDSTSYGEPKRRT